MTPSNLKYNYEINHPEGKFFTRSNMKFAGDTIKNFGCYDGGKNWILYRKSPVKHGRRGSFKFSKSEFKYLGVQTVLEVSA